MSHQWIIDKDNCRVCVDKSVVSEPQFRQITAQESEILLTRVSDPSVDSGVFAERRSLRSTKGGEHDMNATDDCHQLVLNHMNGNVLNVVNSRADGVHKRPVGRPLKRRSSRGSDTNRAKCETSNGWSRASNTSSGDSETKNKENKSDTNSELSRVIGLPNMGNTCYINAIIQVLRITPGFRKFVCFLNKTIKEDYKSKQLNASNKQLITYLHDIFHNFGQNESKSKHVTNSLTNESTITAFIESEELKNRFETQLSQQNDCHEFLSWLINELNTYTQLLFPTDVSREMSRWNTNAKNGYNSRRGSRSLEHTITFQSFNGVMLRNIVCSECQTSSFTDDSFADIQIPLCDNEDNGNERKPSDIGHNKQSFTDIIHRKDYLKDDNMFDCRKCSKKTDASVVNTIKVPPKVLIICMKKPFGFNPKVTRSSKPWKKLFKVPLNLDYTLESDCIKYSLYGFVVHTMGTDISNGHYYAVVNSPLEDMSVRTRNKDNDCMCAKPVLSSKGWIKVNDNNVIKFSDQRLHALLNDESIASTPYLAFYRRLD